jgi:putative Holliday junction resolvase
LRYNADIGKRFLPDFHGIILDMALPLRASPSVRNDPHSGVILAIDYGRKRLGLALSDELGVTSRPFAIWTRINRRRDLARLRDLTRQHAVRRIVIGLPLHLDGADSDMSGETKGFAARVEKTLGIPVEMVDERLSSWEAERTVQANVSSAPVNRAGGQRPGRKPRRTFDDVAAAVILRDYLGRIRSQAGTRG